MAMLLLTLGIAATGLVIWLYRNHWVYRVRTDILHADPEVYRTLPTYNAMMIRFWMWDASRFIGWHPDHETVERRARARAAARGRAILCRRIDRQRR